MREDILECVFQLGPQTVYQIADWLQEDVYEVSTLAVELMDDGKLYLEPADGTLWYAEAVDE